jgi:hypothetical protein|nr:MAG TPA: nucleoside triphosphate pyrophosphohydrolase [Bacteriophage sp.]
MERLTERWGEGDVWVKEHDYVSAAYRLAAYEDTGLTPDEIKSMKDEHFSGLEMAKLYSALMKLEKYQEADKDGRVVVLPCKVGQRVFALLDTDKHISECEVKQIGMGNKIGFIGLEPMAELQNVLCKFLRGRIDGDTLVNIAEEIADVGIMLDQMAIEFKVEDAVAEQRAYKVRRLRSRLE